MLNSPNDEAKREEYIKLNHEVKKAVKRQKNNNIQEKVEEIEMDFKMNNSHNLFKHVREIEGKGKKPFSMVKDTHTNKDEVLKC